MKIYIFFFILALVIFSCEKEPANKPADEEHYTSGDLLVGFVENAKLKSAFNLMNSFDLEITRVSGIHYISKLPADSIDYVVDQLKTKPYLNYYRWHIQKDGNVYLAWGTGIINVASIMVFMDETRQTDWAITASVLKLSEQPSEKFFYLRVPEGKEIYWRDKLRHENIISWAQLNYTGTYYNYLD